MICNIWVFHIYPISNLVSHFFPNMNILENTVFTFFNKFFYAIILNLFFSWNSKFLFNFKFYWKSMCIPSSFTRYIITFHNFVSWNYILHYSCFYMSYMWHSICCWRSIIKHEIFLSLIFVKILFYYVFFFP